MADKEKENEKDESQEKKSGGVLKIVLMVGLPLMLVQTAVAYLLISKFVQVPKAATAEQVEKEEEEEGPARLYVIEDVIINPAETAGSRFLNATVALEYVAKELEQELVEKEVQLRDILINILASKTITELDGPDDRERLKQEILERCNSILKKGKIKRVYFSNFIMQ